MTFQSVALSRFVGPEMHERLNWRARQAAQFTLNPRDGLSTLAKVNESKIEGKSSCPAFGRTRFADL